MCVYICILIYYKKFIVFWDFYIFRFYFFIFSLFEYNRNLYFQLSWKKLEDIKGKLENDINIVFRLCEYY